MLSKNPLTFHLSLLILDSILNILLKSQTILTFRELKNFVTNLDELPRELRKKKKKNKKSKKKKKNINKKKKKKKKKKLKNARNKKEAFTNKHRIEPPPKFKNQ